MKVGDLVKDNYPTRSHMDKIGLIMARATDDAGYMRINKCFKVLWRNGTIGDNVWDYDLKVVNESR